MNLVKNAQVFLAQKFGIFTVASRRRPVLWDSALRIGAWSTIEI